MVHKWESLDHDDPPEEAKHKAKVINHQLWRHVAAVIPVSGPLGLAGRRLPMVYWDRLAAFVATISTKLMREILSGIDKKFTTRASKAPLSMPRIANAFLRSQVYLGLASRPYSSWPQSMVATTGTRSASM